MEWKQVAGLLQPCLTGEVGGSKGKGFRRRAHKRSAEPREPPPCPREGQRPLALYLVAAPASCSTPAHKVLY